MTLVFHGHPLSSFCWKVLIALYENETRFAYNLVNLGDPEERGAFAALWPVGKMPVLEDKIHDRAIAETSIIIEYLDRHHRGSVRFVPEDPDRAREARFWDRVSDLYLQAPMQKIVLDRLRREGGHDPTGVEEARALLATTLGLVDGQAARGKWLAGEAFTLADCAAAPALYYADKVMPLAGRFPAALALLERLKARPSFARVLEEAAPYADLFPSE